MCGLSHKAVGGAQRVARLQVGHSMCTFCLWYICASRVVACPAALHALSLVDQSQSIVVLLMSFGYLSQLSVCLCFLLVCEVAI